MYSLYIINVYSIVYSGILYSNENEPLLTSLNLLGVMLSKRILNQKRTIKKKKEYNKIWFHFSDKNRQNLSSVIEIRSMAAFGIGLLDKIQAT